MPGRTRIFKIIFLISIILIYACEETPQSPGSPFEVTVTDTPGFPLAGAVVEGGIDWDYFRETTDSLGRAVMPGFAFDVMATIKKNNHYSIRVDHLRPTTYVLEPTPCRLIEIGDIEGDLVKFDLSGFFTINYRAEYRAYSLDGNTLTEIAMIQLPDEARGFKLLGDQFWYNTHENGIYIFDLADPLNPVELFHLDIEGYPRTFNVRDSLLAVGLQGSLWPIRLYSYSPDGTVTELDRIEDNIAIEIYFRSHYLITTGYSLHLYNIYDIADPGDIQFVNENDREGYSSAFLYGDTLILASYSYSYDGENTFLMIDISDPSDPIEIGSFAADGMIERILDDSTAVGRYYYDDEALSVFSRSPGEDFRAVALVSEFYGIRDHQGSDPPYFLMGDKLWELEDR